jgi:hypothetical protein
MVSLGYSIWNKHVVSFGVCNVRSMVPKKHQKDYCILARTFIDRRRDIFQDVDVVLIERQLRADMKQFATALRAFLWSSAKVLLVSPIVVKRFFNISMGKYYLNKKASVAMFSQTVSAKSLQDFNLFKMKQKTDIADAFLQLRWYLFKYNIIPLSPHA